MIKLAYPSGTIISLNILKMVEKITKLLQQSQIGYISRSNSEKFISFNKLVNSSAARSNSEKSISSNELVSSSAGSGLYFLFLHSGDPGPLKIVGSGLYFLF